MGIIQLHLSFPGHVSFISLPVLQQTSILQRQTLRWVPPIPLEAKQAPPGAARSVHTDRAANKGSGNRDTLIFWTFTVTTPLSAQTYQFFLPISTIWADPRLSPLKVQCHAWHKPTCAAPSSTLQASTGVPSPELSGWVISSLPQSCRALIALGAALAQAFHTQPYFPSSQRSSTPFLFSPAAALSHSSSSLFFIIQRRSLLPKPEGGPEDPDPHPGAHLPTFPPEIKSIDTYTELGDQDALKFSK